MTAVILKPSKDTKWLTLDVCNDYTKGECEKNENECNFAHPPSHVEASNGKVICCFDSIKSKCQRTNPPCKYLHPPAHLRDQLLEMGRQNLILKNLQLQSVLNSGLYQPVIAVSNSHSLPHHNNHPMAYQMGASSKTTMLPPSYQTIVLPRQPYETATSPYLLQPAPAMQMQSYQLLSPTHHHPGVASNGAMVQLVNPCANFIYLNGATAPVNNQASLSPASLTPAQHSYPGVQVISYNDSLIQPQQYQQHKYQQQQPQYQQPQHYISSYRSVEETASQMSQHNARKRSYQSSSSPPSSLSSSSPSSLLLNSSTANTQNHVPSGYLQGSKRPALVDMKSGLPLYNPHQPTSFPSTPQFIPIAITPQSPYIHRL